MQVLIRDYLANRAPESRAKLDAIFAAWIATGPQAQAIMASSPPLRDAEPRAQQLVELGTTGQQALAYLDKHEAAPAGWTQTNLTLIDQAEIPVGLVRFTMLQPMKDLVKAVPN